MDGIPDHDEVVHAPKIIVDDVDAGRRPPSNSSGGGGCGWWLGGVIVFKIIVALVVAGAKNEAKKPQFDYQYDGDIGFSMPHSRDIHEIPLSGFDPAGEPVITLGNDGIIRLVFEQMPPSYVEDHSELGTFSDLDQQISDATGVTAAWEDRHTISLADADADTLAKVMEFLRNYPRPEVGDNVVRYADEAMIASVCRATADHFGLPANEVFPSTTLRELNADDLDLVELIIHLEDVFDIRIPDQAISQSFANGERWDYSKITMTTLADVVSQQK